MGNPALLQELPNIAALLPQGGGDGEQPAAADGAAGGLDAMADLAVNHRLPQCPLGSVVGGLDPWRFQKSPERLLALQQLATGSSLRFLAELPAKSRRVKKSCQKLGLVL